MLRISFNYRFGKYFHPNRWGTGLICRPGSWTFTWFVPLKPLTIDVLTCTFTQLQQATCIFQIFNRDISRSSQLSATKFDKRDAGNAQRRKEGNNTTGRTRLYGYALYIYVCVCVCLSVGVCTTLRTSKCFGANRVHPG